jgi:cell division protein FtsB
MEFNQVNNNAGAVVNSTDFRVKQLEAEVERLKADAAGLRAELEVLRNHAAGKDAVAIAAENERLRTTISILTK